MTGERIISYRDALREALCEEMRADESVFLIGEDIGIYGGAFAVTKGLIEEFGETRVRDTPISEAGIVGIAVGSALTGMRPVAEMMFMDFITIAMDQVVNQAAKIRFMYGGKARVPLVLRLPAGCGTGAAAQHSQSLEAWLIHTPGLKVVMPSTPNDAKALLKSAIHDDNPVMFIEHKLLYSTTGPVREDPIPLGKADVKRDGKHITLVATGYMLLKAIAACDMLAGRGIEVEVIDPRTLFPLDIAAIGASLRKTHQLLIVHEAPVNGGFGAEVAARIAESDFFDDLDGPIRRLAGQPCPVPYSKHLERSIVPQELDIVRTVGEMLNHKSFA
jgi:acetoin:2,6-dichlorophenolindophenol oxidoreductase subunit beta